MSSRIYFLLIYLLLNGLLFFPWTPTGLSHAKAKNLNEKNKTHSSSQKKINKSSDPKGKTIQNFPVDQKASKDYKDFEEIIEEFSEPPSYKPKILTPRETDLLSHTIFHGSLGFNYALIHLKNIEDKSNFKAIQGLNIAFGIHLFSPVWLSEADFRFFGPLKIKKSNYYISEFNLKLVHKPHLGKLLHIRTGLGFLNRYLTITRIENESSDGTDKEEKESRSIHPALNVFLGFEVPINSFMSLSTDVEYALSLVKEAIHNHSLETIFKINIYF